MGFMPRKKRSTDEVAAILKAHAEGMRTAEVCKNFEISEAAFYRLLNTSRGLPSEPSRDKAQKKIEKLENALRARDREIALLKAALKKS